jgi:nucleotide-binding universal stress UspA family protein
MNTSSRAVFTLGALCCALYLGGCGSGPGELAPQSQQVAKILAKHLPGRHVAVFEFPDDEGCVTLLGQHIREQLTVHLSQALRRREGFVVERRELPQIVRSVEIDMASGDPSQIARSYARLVHADVVVLGSASYVEGYVFVSVRAVNVDGGEILAAEDIQLFPSYANRKLLVARPSGPSLMSPTGAQCAFRPIPSRRELKGY